MCHLKFTFVENIIRGFLFIFIEHKARDPNNIFQCQDDS